VRKDGLQNLHDKVLIIDHKIVVTGSYNFSRNAETNDENTLIIYDERLPGCLLNI
jgi:phosphatidylserine/phosphatidylglycerophosphate/cardiolipin synthase-like enzyme